MVFIADGSALARALAFVAILHASVLAGHLVPNRDSMTDQLLCLDGLFSKAQRADIQYVGGQLEIPQRLIQQLVACIFCLDSLDGGAISVLPDTGWHPRVVHAQSPVHFMPGLHEIRVSARDPPGQQHT